jgi:hypothetical protein
MGWFTPVPRHRYVVTFRAETDVPALRQSSASLDAYLAYKETQLAYGLGNLVAMMWAGLAIPFVMVGLPLLLFFRPHRYPPQM